MAEVWQSLNWALGLDVEELSLWQMLLRAAVVYIAALIMVRFGEKRFLGKSTAFDVILGIILGSVVSRAINGSAEFFPTLAAGFVLVGLHWLFAVLTFHSDRLGTLIKGETRLLIKQGEIQWDAMRKSHIGKNDLLGAIRSESNRADLTGVEEAYLERSGEISIIRAPSGPKVLEVTVAEGVQTVRIQLE